MRSIPLWVKVGGVCWYHIICCLMYTLCSPQPALKFLGHTSQKHSMGQSLHPPQAPHLRWVSFHLGYLRAFSPGKEKSQGLWLPSLSCPCRNSAAPNHSTGGGTRGPVPTQAVHGGDAWHWLPSIAAETGAISHPLLPTSPPPHTPQSPSLFSAFSSPLSPCQGHLSTACPEHVPGMAAHGEEVQRQLWVLVWHHGRTLLPYLETQYEVKLRSWRPSKRKELHFRTYPKIFYSFSKYFPFMFPKERKCSTK